MKIKEQKQCKPLKTLLYKGRPLSDLSHAEFKAYHLKQMEKATFKAEFVTTKKELMQICLKSNLYQK